MERTNKKLKIGLVVDDTLDKPDGVQQYVLALGHWLQSQGHQVHYLAGQTDRTDLPDVHSLSRNFSVKFNGNFLSTPLPANKREIRALLEREQFDVLHVQLPYSPFLAGRIIRQTGPKTAVIGTFHILPHSHLVGWGTRLLGTALKRSLKRFDTIYSVSTAAQKFARNSFGIKTEVMPNMFDYATFHQAKPYPEYGDDTQTILFLGRLVPRKGCQVLLEAVKILQDSYQDLPKFRVVVCGKGELRDSLEAYAQANQLQDIVSFTGFVSEEDKPRYYASADITVFPSSGGESFGIVLLEAMATGDALVLAGDNPGYRSVMQPLSDEQLFDPTNPQLLAEKLHQALQEPTTRRKQSELGAAYVKKFDTNEVAAQILDGYTEVLRKRLKT